MRFPTLLLLAMGTLAPSLLTADQEAYPRTPAGTIATKTLPAARLLRAECPKNYFEANNGLFMQLFRYIQSRKIPMTTPVEAAIDPGAMFFYLAHDSALRSDLEPTRSVQILDAPSRMVAAIGVRGSYTRENFETALAKLQSWLATQPHLRPVGKPYAVYWNSPFVPGFLKQSEVHIPVESRPEGDAAR